MKPFFTAFTFVFLSIAYLSQNGYNTNGTHFKNKAITVFTNAVIHVDGATQFANGTLIIQGNKVLYAGGKTKTPSGAVAIDLKGKHIYPSFIELDAQFGIKKPVKNKPSKSPQYHSSKKGPYYWNEAIQTEVNAIDQYTYDDKVAKAFRKNGFGVVLTHDHEGIVRGTSCLVALTDNKEDQILVPSAAENLSLRKGVSKQVYPTSLMGSIALLRQYYYDAEFYTKHQESEKTNLTLDGYITNKSLPKFFEIRNELSLLRAAKIGNEFDLKYNYIGNGDEYQAIAEIKQNIQGAIVIPLNFPKPYEVSDPFDAKYVTLAELKHWEAAPFNPSILEKEQIAFAISSSKLKDSKKFLPHLRLAVSKGLSKETALNALTKIPARLLAQSNSIGSLEKDKLANFIITSADIFETDAIIYENWVQGRRYEIQNPNLIDIRGEYNLNVNQLRRTLKVTGTVTKPKGVLEYDIVADSTSKSGDLVIDAVTGKPLKITKNKKVKVDLSVDKDFVNLSYNLSEGLYRLSGNINYDSGSWDGKGQSPDGTWLDWSAIRKKKNKAKKKTNKNTTSDSLLLKSFNFPAMAYGWDSLPKQQAILIKNATVWTLEQEGNIKADVLIREGKIVAIANILDVVDASTVVIDAANMHLTPGIIDEHSHIAIANGVNEGSHAVTAEVRIGDVIRNDDINIYRQLAGGTTAAQLLHGSANPVGGQAAMIKLRWGSSPEQMKIQGADGFIKFALGENVKQSNWGDHNRLRFPQTRMGVEQVYYDAFSRAKEYKEKWDQYDKASAKKKSVATPPKYDIQLEILVEILESRRFVTCHSYVQSEINMLMHVADSMGFTINTFTHILEGYKLADKMIKHGVGASTFSDWWAYKYEVNDAIPYNASLLNKMGIITAINSDDAEMGRRLNQEAAKGIKYGGMSEEDALKMVTLNPAKLLHLDDRMGSIKVGKDADLVLWSNNPLSIYAQVQYTIVDGIIYFDKKRDLQMQAAIAKEKSRIIQKMIAAKNNGSDTQQVNPKKNRVHICTSVGDGVE